MLLARRRGIEWLEAPAVERRHYRKVTDDSRHNHWISYAVERFLSDRPRARMLFAGCGAGSLERDVLGLVPLGSAQAFDLSLAGLAAASRAARAGTRRVAYFAADANTLTLPAACFDAVWFQNSLHHVAALEHLLQQIAHALRPGGMLICLEYVGANAFDFPERQKRALIEAFALIPPRLRRNRASARGEVIDGVGIPSPVAVRRHDPSESVRSSEILACVRQGFEIVELREMGGSLLQFVLNNIAGNFTDEDEEAQAVLGRLFELEDSLIASGEIGSDFVFFVATPRPPQPHAGPAP